MAELQEVIEIDHIKAKQIRGSDLIVFDGRVRQVVLLDRFQRPNTKLILTDILGSSVEVEFDNDDIIELVWR